MMVSTYVGHFFNSGGSGCGNKILPKLSTSTFCFSYFCLTLLKASIGSRYILYRDINFFLDAKMANSEGIWTRDPIVSAGTSRNYLVQERI